jgi:hypothetical protein
MPIMPSPSYHKYDVSNYKAIDKKYGTMEDFDELSKLCNERDVKLIIDLVLNHSSTQHPWFKECVESIKKGDLVSIKKGAKYYTGKSVPTWVINTKWYVASVSGDRAIIDKSEDGRNAICSPINVSYLTVAKKTTAPTIKVGSTVKVNSGAKTYDGKKLASFVYSRKHKVKELKGDRAVITYLGVTVCAISTKNLTLV